MLSENSVLEKSMAFVSRDDVTVAGIKIETQEMISDLKRVWTTQ
jgi:hypothetical protein